MDEQRLERALRGGPPFATRYVSRPLTLDDSLGGRRGAGVGRLVLLVAVTALLLAGMLGGLAALGGLRDDPGPRQEDTGVIPGLDGQAFMAAFEATESRPACSEPQPATGMLLQWTCRDVGDGNVYDEAIILLGESPSAIHSIEAWVALADGSGPVDADHAGGLFAFVADTAEFTGADIAAARAWALENGGRRSAHLEISGVTYTLSGPAERRVLKIAVSPACFLTTECPPASGVPIDTRNWVPFTSERYGYAIAHPPAWTATPAKRAWAFDIDQQLPGCCDLTGTDQFRNPKRAPTTAGVYPIHLTAFAVDEPAGTSEDVWIAEYYAGRPNIAPGFCLYANAERRPILVDGQPGTMVVGDTDCDDAAFVFVDGRAYVFQLEALDNPAQMPEWRTLKTALLEAFLGTVEFRP